MVSGARTSKKGDRFWAKRLATAAEVESWKSLLVPEDEALQHMRDRVQSLGVNITLHRAEFQIDMKKLTLHYSTNIEHPDFSILLHEGHHKYNCRIWLNNCQPGVRGKGEPLDLSAPPIPTLD